MEEFRHMKSKMDEIEKQWNIKFSSGKGFIEFLTRFKHETFNVFEDFYHSIGFRLSEEFCRHSSIILASTSIVSIDEKYLCESKSLKEFLKRLFVFLIPIFSFMDKVEEFHDEQEISKALKEIDHISPKTVKENSIQGYSKSLVSTLDYYPMDIYEYLICVIMNYYLFCIFNRVLIFSTGVDIRASLNNNRLQLLPEGAKILDEQIVNQDLIWLIEHPVSLEF